MSDAGLTMEEALAEAYRIISGALAEDYPAVPLIWSGQPSPEPTTDYMLLSCSNDTPKDVATVSHLGDYMPSGDTSGDGVLVRQEWRLLTLSVQTRFSGASPLSAWGAVGALRGRLGFPEVWAGSPLHYDDRADAVRANSIVPLPLSPRSAAVLVLTVKAPIVSSLTVGIIKTVEPEVEISP